MKPGDTVTVRPMERNEKWKHLGPPTSELHNCEPSFKATVLRVYGETALIKDESGRQINVHVSILHGGS
jgi:hypothetical protein